MLRRFGQLGGLGEVRGTRPIVLDFWPLWLQCTAFIPPKLLTAEVPVPQGADLARKIQDSDFLVQLRTTCDSVLHAYLSKVADTAEKRYYLKLSCSVVGSSPRCLDVLPDYLCRLGILDLHLSDFQPYNLCFLLAARCHLNSFRNYFAGFRRDPERSKEFHFEYFRWPGYAFVATRCMRFLRKLSNPRWGIATC